MSQYVTNHSEIARRGGEVLSDSGFVVVACTQCARQYLYDTEVLQLYPDPDDLSTRFLNSGSDVPACSGCRGKSATNTASLSNSSIRSFCPNGAI